MFSTQTTRSFPKALILTSSFVMGLWVLHILNVVFSLNLWQFGVEAHSFSGLIGILLSPLIHGNWSHLASNTPAILVLGTSLFYGYPRSAPFALGAIWLGSGLLTWLLARPDVFHFGASGLTHGLMFFLFTLGILRRDALSIALALIVFFLYGGMIWSIFPNEPGISFEMHLFGAIMGVIMAFVLKKNDKALPRKQYSWERETETQNDLIGDEWMQKKEAAENKPLSEIIQERQQRDNSNHDRKFD